MKTWTIKSWSLSVAMAVLPLASGCARDNVGAAPTIVTSEAPAAFSETDADVVTPPPATAPDLENAPAKVVSTPAQVAPATSLSPAAAEVARLSQSGVDESVVLAFVNNSSDLFAVGSEQIIYLTDIGVPGNVVTAMIQRDQVLKNAGATTTTAPVYANQPPPPPIATQEMAAPEPPPTIAQDAPPLESNVTSTYFRDSLSPYGNWIEVEGYGQCWQPSAVVVDRSWTPYCDRGRWVYSDCGWYWSSDYSWGWAPFHYGRWFRHSRMGWCWAPDTVWGPSWVSWRYNAGYCGWAPLPPAAYFRPGFGFSYYGRPVGASFGFGLGVNHFTFVATERFCDPHPFQYRVPPQRVTQIFNNTTIINPVIEDRGNPRFHRGIPAKNIAAVTHTEIKPVTIRESTSVPVRGRGEVRDRDHGTLTVFQPALPQPPAHSIAQRIGEGIKPATARTAIPRIDPGAALSRAIPARANSPATIPPATPDRRNDSVPIYQAPTVGNNQFRNAREPEKIPAPEVNRGITTDSPVFRNGASPAVTTPNLPAAQNRALPKNQPTTIPPQPTLTPSASPFSPARQNPPSTGEGIQRGQPRQQRIFAPTIPAAPTQIRSAQQLPAYQAPPQNSSPQLAPTGPRGDFNPAPARAVPAQVPQVSAPPSAPATPRGPAPRPSANGDDRPRNNH